MIREVGLSLWCLCRQDFKIQQKEISALVIMPHITSTSLYTWLLCVRRTHTGEWKSLAAYSYQKHVKFCVAPSVRIQALPSQATYVWKLWDFFNLSAVAQRIPWMIVQNHIPSFSSDVNNWINLVSPMQYYPMSQWLCIAVYPNVVGTNYPTRVWVDRPRSFIRSLCIDRPSIRFAASDYCMALVMITTFCVI